MREYTLQVHLVDDVKGIARTEVITDEPVRAIAEYVLMYDPAAWPTALPRLRVLRDEVTSMVTGNTVVFSQALIDGSLRLEVAINVHALSKLEQFEEALLEAS